MIDLSNPNSSCSNLAAFPILIDQTVGELISKQFPLICGGDLSDLCFVIGQSESSLVAKMLEKRRGASGLLLNENTFWISGGYNGENLLNSSEIIEYFPNSDTWLSTSGPDLPTAINHHSSVMLNEFEAMIIGGYTESDSNKTFVYNFETRQWRKGPDLIKGRENTAAAIVTDGVTNAKKVVVAGGYNFGYLFTVEILNLPYTSESKWFEGTDRVNIMNP